MKHEVIIPENNLANNLDKAELEKFSNEVKNILAKEDYDFSSIKEIALFVLFSENGTNIIEVKTESRLSNDEEIGLSLMRARLQHIIQSHSKDSKFFGINATFYLTLNYTKEVQDRLRQTTQKDNINTIAQQKDSKQATLNLKLETPRYTMAQIELSKKTKKGLTETIMLVEKQSLIYDEWGFREVDSVAKTIINFYGKPGTGKTMSAHIIASELNKKIIHSNYADIESKYVGDAPKNLVAAFDLAQKENALLFFDEADSFLGKRISNVSQSSDQAVNALRSELLKLLEERPVIVIFATNLLENYDKAFHSRFLRSVRFELPNKRQRKAIIQKHIPNKLYEKGVKIDESELNQLSEMTDGFSGREIKNSVLNTLILAAKEDRLPSFKDFKKAFKTSKKEFDKSHENEKRNESLGNQVKKNLKKGNYKTIRSKNGNKS